MDREAYLLELRRLTIERDAVVARLQAIEAELFSLILSNPGNRLCKPVPPPAPPPPAEPEPQPAHITVKFINAEGEEVAPPRVTVGPLEYGGVRDAILAAMADGEPYTVTQLVEETGLTTVQVSKSMSYLEATRKVQSCGYVTRTGGGRGSRVRKQWKIWHSGRETCDVGTVER